MRLTVWNTLCWRQAGSDKCRVWRRQCNSYETVVRKVWESIVRQQWQFEMDLFISGLNLQFSKSSSVLAKLWCFIDWAQDVFLTQHCKAIRHGGHGGAPYSTPKEDTCHSRDRYQTLMQPLISRCQYGDHAEEWKCWAVSYNLVWLIRFL